MPFDNEDLKRAMAPGIAGEWGNRLHAFLKKAGV
jgi:hypothetical protein